MLILINQSGDIMRTLPVLAVLGLCTTTSLMADPAVYQREKLEEFCKESIRSAVYNKALTDFEKEVETWRKEPIEEGSYTLQGTEHWKHSGELTPTILFSIESTPFEHTKFQREDGKVELSSYLLAVFPKENIDKGTLGFKYIARLIVQPVRMYYDYKKNPLDGRDKTEGFLVDDSAGCQVELSMAPVYLGKKLEDLRFQVSSQDKELLEEYINQNQK